MIWVNDVQAFDSLYTVNCQNISFQTPDFDDTKSPTRRWRYGVPDGGLIRYDIAPFNAAGVRHDHQVKYHTAASLVSALGSFFTASIIASTASSRIFPRIFRGL